MTHYTFIIRAVLAMPFALALTVIVAQAGVRSPDEKSGKLPFEPAEEMVYQGELSKLMLRGINIAEFTFTAGRAPSENNLQFTAEARSVGFFRKLFGLVFRFRVESTVDPRSFAVLRTTKVDEQGERVRLSEAVFDNAAGKVVWTERDPKNPARPPRVATSQLSGVSHDVISAIYFLRTLPLTPGQSFDLQMSDSGAVYRIPVSVVEKKRMKTIIGEVSAVRVDVDMFGEGRLVKDRGQMSIWFTDDARHIPVSARITHDLGTISLTLKKLTR